MNEMEIISGDHKTRDSARHRMTATGEKMLIESQNLESQELGW